MARDGRGGKMAEKGIKEIVELLDGVKVLAIEAKQALADGSIGMGDLKELLDLFSNVGVLTAAVQGVGEIPSEIKDLSGEEAQALVGKVLELAQAVKAA
jgi:hypothetical protein